MNNCSVDAQRQHAREWAEKNLNIPTTHGANKSENRKCEIVKRYSIENLYLIYFKDCMYLAQMCNSQFIQKRRSIMLLREFTQLFIFLLILFRKNQHLTEICPQTRTYLLPKDCLCKIDQK